MELCRKTGVAGFEVFKKLKDMGYLDVARILVSRRDVEDYHRYNATHSCVCTWDEETDEEIFQRVVNHLISNSAYFDIPFAGPDGKMGLKDTLGDIVVPPIFDWVEGTSYLFYEKCMARVKMDGKYWLSPRDGSGRIIGSGYEKIEPYFSSAQLSEGLDKGWSFWGRVNP